MFYARLLDPPSRRIARSKRTDARTCTPSVRTLRKQLEKQGKQVTEAEAEQLAVVSDYALGVQAALNLDGTLPFHYAGVEAAEALDETAASLERLAKKGEQ